MSHAIESAQQVHLRIFLLTRKTGQTPAACSLTVLERQNRLGFFQIVTLCPTNFSLTILAETSAKTQQTEVCRILSGKDRNHGSKKKDYGRWRGKRGCYCRTLAGFKRTWRRGVG